MRTGVLDDGLLRSTTHTCNDVFQVENIIKFIALRGVSSLNSHARKSKHKPDIDGGAHDGKDDLHVDADYWRITFGNTSNET